MRLKISILSNVIFCQKPIAKIVGNYSEWGVFAKNSITKFNYKPSSEKLYFSIFLSYVWSTIKPRFQFFFFTATLYSQVDMTPVALSIFLVNTCYLLTLYFASLLSFNRVETHILSALLTLWYLLSIELINIMLMVREM